MTTYPYDLCFLEIVIIHFFNEKGVTYFFMFCRLYTLYVLITHMKKW